MHIALGASCEAFLGLWDLQKLLEEDDDELEHLVMLLRALLLLDYLVHMADECLNHLHFWRHEVLHASVELLEKIKFNAAIAILIWQLGKLDTEHEAEE